MVVDEKQLIGKTILVGISKLREGSVVETLQLYGKISTATKEQFIIQLSSGKSFQLPPHYLNVTAATPGEYKLRTTGEIVINPDFIATWELHLAPDQDGSSV